MDHLCLEEYSRPIEYDVPFGRARAICLDYVPEKFAAWVAKHDELQGLLYLPDRQVDDDLERPGLLDQIRVGFPCLSRSCQTEDCLIGQLKETRDMLAAAMKGIGLVRAEVNNIRKVSATEVFNTMDECTRIFLRDCFRRITQVNENFRNRFMNIRHVLHEQANEFVTDFAERIEMEDSDGGTTWLVKIGHLLDDSEDCLQAVWKNMVKNVSFSSCRNNIKRIDAVRRRLAQRDYLQGELAGIHIISQVLPLIEEGFLEFVDILKACGPIPDPEDLKAGPNATLILKLKKEKQRLNARVLGHLRGTTSTRLQLTFQKLDHEEASWKIKTEIEELESEIRLEALLKQIKSKQKKKKGVSGKKKAKKPMEQKWKKLYQYRSPPKERRHTTPAAFDRDDAEMRDLWLGPARASKRSGVPESKAATRKPAEMDSSKAAVMGVPKESVQTGVVKPRPDAAKEMKPKPPPPHTKGDSKAEETSVASDSTWHSGKSKASTWSKEKMAPRKPRKAREQDTKVEGEVPLALEALGRPKPSRKPETKMQRKFRLAEEAKWRRKLEEDAEMDEPLWLALRHATVSEEESTPEEDMAALEEDVAALEEDLAILEEQLEEVDWMEAREEVKHPRRHTVPRFPPLLRRVGPSFSGEEDEEEQQPVGLVHVATMTDGPDATESEESVSYQHEWESSDWACGLELGEIRGHAMPVRRDRPASPRWRDEMRAKSRRRALIVWDKIQPMEQLTRALDDGDTFVYAIPALLDRKDGKRRRDKQKGQNVVNVLEGLDTIDLSRVKIKWDKLSKPEDTRPPVFTGIKVPEEKKEQKLPMVVIGERDWLIQCCALRHMAMSRRESQMSPVNIGTRFGAILNKVAPAYEELPDQKPIGVHKVTFPKRRRKCG